MATLYEPADAARSPKADWNTQQASYESAAHGAPCCLEHLDFLIPVRVHCARQWVLSAA
jgi:hypothetical protein